VPGCRRRDLRHREGVIPGPAPPPDFPEARPHGRVFRWRPSGRRRPRVRGTWSGDARADRSTRTSYPGHSVDQCGHMRQRHLDMLKRGVAGEHDDGHAAHGRAAWFWSRHRAVDKANTSFAPRAHLGADAVNAKLTMRLAVEAELPTVPRIPVRAGCLQGPALAYTGGDKQFGHCAGRGGVDPSRARKTSRTRRGCSQHPLLFCLLVHLHKAGKAAYLG
jgi:hypothetical protein